MIHDGLWCAFENWHMGEAAEHIAAKYGVSRADQDRFSAQSHQRAAAAWEKGSFNAEVMPSPSAAGDPKAQDRRPRRRHAARHDRRRPGEAEDRRSATDGTVTAGNASMLSDGAAAVVVGSAHAAEKLGTKPLARIVAYATSGVAPKDIFIAPVLAVRQVLDKAKLTLKDIDLFELNEAFAAQMLACGKELKLDEAKVNVNGGAIALGHPIGASGARVLVTLLYALEQRGLKRGLGVTVPGRRQCGGDGGGAGVRPNADEGNQVAL